MGGWFIGPQEGAGILKDGLIRNFLPGRTTMGQGFHLTQEFLVAFCQRHHIQRLSLFGSTLRGEDRPDSDVDLLVKFKPGHTPDLFTLADMEEELSQQLLGRKVDLRTPREISRYFRDQVLASAQVQYAA